MADMTQLEKVQDYRFGSMMKGKHYAYARGLTISVQHLPAALDAMLADGWELMSLFGDTDANKVGFVFRRVDDEVIDLRNSLDLDREALATVIGAMIEIEESPLSGQWARGKARESLSRITCGAEL